MKSMKLCAAQPSCGRHSQSIHGAIGAERSPGRYPARRSHPLFSARLGWLLDLIKNAPEPNARLKAAMTRYQQSKRDDADTSFNWEP